MGKASKYTSKVADDTGFIHYTDEEHSVWRDLITAQRKILPTYAADVFLEALERMGFSDEHVPQCDAVSEVIREFTGWGVAPVPALINFDRFFALLAEKRFPCATFIRSREEIEYLQEPDIFHEVFGHTPLLTDPRFAEFTYAYGQAGLRLPKEDRKYLAALYWFTVEFGLINTRDGLRTYGAGVVSSMGETPYSIESDIPARKPFDPIEAMRTPYRIDVFQTTYFVIDSLDDLFDVAQMDLVKLVAQAKSLGQYEPTYPPKDQAAAV